MPRPTTEQLARINQMALVPLTEEQVYTFPARILGTKLIQKYVMKITPNFLNKMAGQVKEGIALLVDHPWASFGVKSIPYGRTFDSRIVSENGELEMYGDHYMVLGQEFDEISTDQLAAGIDAGTIFDTSAGFMTTKHTCSICNESYYNSGCMHIRGREYDGKMCIVICDDGFIMENSFVFDGGYEGAGIVKNSLSHKTSEQKEEPQFMPLSMDAKHLEGDGSVFYCFSNKHGLSAFVQGGQKTLSVAEDAKGDDHMPENDQALIQAQTALTNATALLTQIRTALGVATDDGILAKITSVNSLAQVGEQYKVKITEQACGAGVRAMGDAFNVEAMKLSLSGLPVSEIEKIALSYEAQAKIALGGGGRHTQGGDVNLPANALSGAAPENPQAGAGTTPTAEQLQAKAAEDARAALQRTGNSSIMKEVK